jgi:hypothetical protein
MAGEEKYTSQCSTITWLPSIVDIDVLKASKGDSSTLYEVTSG